MEKLQVTLNTVSQKKDQRKAGNYRAALQRDLQGS